LAPSLPFLTFFGPIGWGVLQTASVTRQDSQSPSPQAPLSDKLVERALTRAVRTKIDARRPDLRLLLRRTLAALERDLPALCAAQLSRTEVAAFLAERLAALSEPSAPARVGGGSDSGEPRAERTSSDRTAAQSAILGALRQLERENPPGALLSVRELRALSDLDKPSFDRAALELAGHGRVSLHAHDHAGALAESERRALIEDVRGVHYVGIASIPDARHEVSL
jgi:hypothetical protein